MPWRQGPEEGRGLFTSAAPRCFKCLSAQSESRHPGRRDYSTPCHTEIISMADARKAIRLPQLVAPKKLLALHANVCSLVPKPGELKILFKSFSEDIPCITETWLNTGVMGTEVFLINYNTFRGNRQSGRREVAILYIKSEVLPRRLPLNFNADSCFVEFVSC